MEPQASTQTIGDSRRRSGRLDPRVAVAAFLLRRIQLGKLTVTTPEGQRLVGRGSAGEEAHLHIHRWRALYRVVTGGDLGFARAVIDGDCSSPDLVGLLRLFDRNVTALGLAANSVGPMRWVQRLAVRLRWNTRAGSARNIMAHYDLGNAFFAAWLDPSLNYSSAIYRDERETLEAAQAHKLEEIVRRLKLAGGERVLEIGCGWGALAVRVLQAGAAKLDALTLSPAQAEIARERLATEGERASVELKDYRDVAEVYDRIVSIEMCEAVGEAFLPFYFETLARAMREGGRAVIQAITISDPRFEAYRRSADFIQRYIFPGGFLPSDSMLRACVDKAGLNLSRPTRSGNPMR